MLNEGLIKEKDYNYPLIQFYRYKNVAHLKGAEKTGRMIVEYAVVLRVEFIPEGAKSGPVKDIYFKIFKKGTCGIIGAVLGWPTLDHPVVPGGEGLGWVNRIDGAEYSALGVTIPRLDDQRKTNYYASVARYQASKGQLMAIDEDSVDRVHLIETEGTRLLRAAAMMAQEVPSAKMERIGMEFFSLEPGERAVVPVQWNLKEKGQITACSTHPEAPTGLTVLAGHCDSGEFMSLVVENESELSITVSEKDMIAVGVEEGILPSLDICETVLAKRRLFATVWTGQEQERTLRGSLSVPARTERSWLLSTESPFYCLFHQGVDREMERPRPDHKDYHNDLSARRRGPCG